MSLDLPEAKIFKKSTMNFYMIGTLCEVSPILVWLSTPDVLLGVFLCLRAWGGPPWGLRWNLKPF